jgi:hypothetical protein
VPYTPAEILERHAAGEAAYPSGKPLARDAATAWAAVTGGATGLLGAATVRDSARREWRVEAHRDRARGRMLVLRPVHGDNEPFRASADGYRPEAFLPIAGEEWTLLALLAAGHEGDAGREDEELAAAAFRLVDRLVREAQHRLLMGESEDED